MKDELVQVLLEVLDQPTGADLARASIRLWHRFLQAFSALIGSCTAYALFQRSLEVNRYEFPWLPVPRGTIDDNEIFVMLKDGFLLQSDESVKNAMRAMFLTYIDLLFDIIGSTLTVKFICNLASSNNP